MSFSVKIDGLALVSESNGVKKRVYSATKRKMVTRSEHWSNARKRHHYQQWLVRAHLTDYDKKITLPCMVTLTRHSPRQLDSDNLQMAFKWIRDEVADFIIGTRSNGRNDSDPRITWQYKQEKTKNKLNYVTISFSPKDTQDLVSPAEIQFAAAGR